MIETSTLSVTPEKIKEVQAKLIKSGFETPAEYFKRIKEEEEAEKLRAQVDEERKLQNLLKQDSERAESNFEENQITSGIDGNEVDEVSEFGY